jgi:hypothetical protein
MTPAQRQTALIGASAAMTLAAGGALAGQNYYRGDVPFAGYLATPCAGLVASGAPYYSAGDQFGFDTFTAPTNCQGALGSTVSGGLNTAANAQWQVPYSGGTGTQAATASAGAGYGWSKLSTSAQAVGSQTPVAGMAMGGWADMLTIVPTDPALIGTQAHLNFNLHVDGQLKVSLGYFAGPYAQIRLSAYGNKLFDFANPLSDTVIQLGMGTTPDAVTTLNVNQTVPMSLTFTLGDTFQMSVFERSLSWIQTQWPIFPQTTASADFSNTFTWQGVSSVTVGGTSVAYTMTSASGVNWANAITPVPEPGSGALVLAGLLLAGRWLRTRRALEEPGA